MIMECSVSFVRVFRKFIFILLFCANFSNADKSLNLSQLPNDSVVHKIGSLLEIFQTSPLIINQLHDVNITRQCRSDIKTYQHAFKNAEMWALKMVDASAKISSSVLNGNVHFLGDFNQCLNVETDGKLLTKYCRVEFFVNHSRELDDIFEEIFSHRMMETKFEDKQHFIPPITELVASFCLPSSCDSSDLEEILYDTFKPFNTSDFRLKLRVRPTACDIRRRANLFNSWQSITLCAVMLVLAVLTTLATATTILKKRNPEGEKNAVTKGLLKSFCLVTNFEKLIEYENMDKRIESVSGLRTLFSFLIYIVHSTGFNLLMPVANRTESVTFFSHASTMLTRSVLIIVDPFVVISGFLTAYFAFRKLKNGGRLNILEMYAVRYVKYAPLLLLVVATLSFLSKEFLGGPVFLLVPAQNAIQKCRDNFWYTVFFIDNIHGLTDMCYPSAHQLFTDMQMTLVAPFLILAMWQLRRYALVLVLTLIVTIHLSLFAMGKFMAVMWMRMDAEEMVESLNSYYVTPFCRCIPYLVGIALGYHLQTTKTTSLPLVTKTVGWSLACASFYYVYFGYSEVLRLDFVYDHVKARTYGFLQPLLWSSTIAWVIYACYHDQSSIINRILSWYPFQVYARISYAVFTIQLLVLFASAARWIRTPLYLTPWSGFNLFNMVAVLSLSVGLTLTVVMPMRNVYDYYFKEKKEKIDSKAL